MKRRFEDETILKEVDENRRNFIKKVIIGSAFAAPVIHSFSMDGLKIRMGAGEARADEKSGFDSTSPSEGPSMAPAPVSPVGPGVLTS